SFDINLIKNFNCNVFCFDPTPRAIQHIKNLEENTNQNIPFYSGPDKIAYNANKAILNKFHFHPFGIWNKNTTIRFYSPQDPAHVSHSITNLQKTETYFEAQCYTLKTLMNKFKHKKLNLLKLDIEGAEIAVINYILKEKIDIDCLCFEFDEFAGNNLKQNKDIPASKNKADKIIKRLIKNGYELIYRSGYISLTFLKKEICNNLKIKRG
ncbi:MAG: FkbM family methyltransferase, partial [Candidatus Babeliales bacterium]|nr:FkbM family methyltransferase [Candidatus Babeliales bacterium]